jgi:hypothetical protein
MEEWLEGYKARARAPISIKQTLLKVKRIKDYLGAELVEQLTTERLIRWRY